MLPDYLPPSYISTYTSEVINIIPSLYIITAWGIPIEIDCARYTCI